MVLLAGGLISFSHAQSGPDAASGFDTASRFDRSYADAARRYKENVLVYTDRNLYTVNESIRFTAMLQSGEKAYRGLGSSVLYLELVNSAGNAVARGKYPILENRTSGQLNLPSSLPTGLYFVRSYTRWMRNFGSRDLSYLPVRVVNPFSDEVSGDRPARVENGLSPVARGQRLVSVSPSRASYHRGDPVEVEFSLETGNISRIPHGCISVVPAGSIDTTGFRYRVDVQPEDAVRFQFNFLPEINGTSISGIITEPGNQVPVADARIHFSILGEEPSYMVTRSDQAGSFAIQVPYRTGSQEMFVVPEYASANPPEVRIDNDFASDPLPFQPGPFTLSGEELELASRMSLNMQVQGTFLADTLPGQVMVRKGEDPVPFYGTPAIRVNMDEFVNLPNLEEVVENLIPNTYVIRRGGSRSFLIKGESPMISMFPPLILIDHIPVFDMEVILDIPPSKLDHIEVIPEVYVLGEVKYGGIISLTSLAGDLASIKLPEGSYFFDYLAFQPQPAPKGARHSGPGKFPDVRNTLYWLDHLELDKGSSEKISFRAASVPGSYLILFRGLTSDGEIVYGMDVFEVEDQP